jgi:hypothetical protein
MDAKQATRAAIAALRPARFCENRARSAESQVNGSAAALVQPSSQLDRAG